jgi:hypothetical protein
MVLDFSTISGNPKYILMEWFGIVISLPPVNHNTIMKPCMMHVGKRLWTMNLMLSRRMKLGIWFHFGQEQM